ncbi:hypothetical protein J6590_003583 [Homalodisca vitripennis]|nr:hypothetical protein J6590_003583 [Homalodisca vitripennis]
MTPGTVYIISEIQLVNETCGEAMSSVAISYNYNLPPVALHTAPGYRSTLIVYGCTCSIDLLYGGGQPVSQADLDYNYVKTKTADGRERYGKQASQDFLYIISKEVANPLSTFCKVFGNFQSIYYIVSNKREDSTARSRRQEGSSSCWRFSPVSR